MKHLILPQTLLFLLAFTAFLVPDFVRAQCTYLEVTHLSGTQQVGCTNVTVTAAGSVSSPTLQCGMGPYWIGYEATGSYTFTFSTPISGVRFNMNATNDNIVGTEELVFYINGSFYPITVPGVANSCGPPMIISPTGTLRATPGTVSSWSDLVINETISSITIDNVYLISIPYGINFDFFICCSGCLTNAGQISAAVLNVCPGSQAVVPAATQTFLQSGDLLNYILFSNPNNTLGSILATSASPAFSFNPATMQPNVTYYIAAIAGNNLNGTVDLNDPCLDISNAIPVTWRPAPTVSLSVGNPNFCQGACNTVTALFTGTPPFNLTYTSPVGGAATQTFTQNNGTFQICVPANASVGNFTVQATGLIDTWCPCN